MTSVQQIEPARGGDAPGLAPPPQSSASESSSPPPHDVDARQYPMVIREMIRHENDVTNHRIMWLLIVQGLIVNAFIGAAPVHSEKPTALPMLGILVTLSAFVMLYKSYHARGYLGFLGRLAKQGELREAQLPMIGWPHARVRGWRRGQWVSRWLDRPGDLLEAYFFVPNLLILLWSFELFRIKLPVGTGLAAALAAVAAPAFLSLFCIVWVWLQESDE
jgi:hypothetical protein